MSLRFCHNVRPRRVGCIRAFRDVIVADLRRGVLTRAETRDYTVNIELRVGDRLTAITFSQSSFLFALAAAVIRVRTRPIIICLRRMRCRVGVNSPYYCRSSDVQKHRRRKRVAREKEQFYQIISRN